MWHKLKREWPDQLPGGWWKASLVIGFYVLLRSLTELLAFNIGSYRSQQMSQTLDIGQIYQNAQVSFFIQALFVTLVTIWLGQKLKLAIFALKFFTNKDLIRIIKHFISFYFLQFIIRFLIYQFSPVYEAPSNQQAVEVMIENMNFFLIFINLIIITPIIEEYLFRGLIMKYTFGKFPILGALLASLLFAWAHRPANLNDFFLYYMLSFPLTLIYCYYRRIEYPIIFHVLINLVSFISSQLL